MPKAPNEVQILRAIGRRIRAAREVAGLTQEDAADRAGIDWRRWQRLEAGTVNATIRTLVKGARALQRTSRDSAIRRTILLRADEKGRSAHR